MVYQPAWVFNAKVILGEKQQGYYLSHLWGIKGIHTFTKGISLKVSIIAWLEFKLAYFIIQHLSHYAKGTPSHLLIVSINSDDIMLYQLKWYYVCINSYDIKFVSIYILCLYQLIWYYVCVNSYDIMFVSTYMILCLYLYSSVCLRINPLLDYSN